MKSPEYVAHGTASSESVSSIKEDGFKFEEGRETVSEDFFMGMDFAQPKPDTLAGSRNVNKVSDERSGSIFVMKAPEGYKIDYGTETGISVDEGQKIIAGHVGKYSGGRKQLGIYRKELEDLGLVVDVVKNEENPIKTASEILGNDIDLTSKVEALKKLDEVIHSENIVAEIVATPGIIEVSNKLRGEVLSLNKSIPEAVLELAVEIERENIETGVELHSFGSREELDNILGKLLGGSLKNSIQERLRLLSLDIKMLQGYEVNDVDKIPGRNFIKPTKESVGERLKVYREVVGKEGFTTGLPEVDRYLLKYLPQLQSEFGKVE
jgi:hypothetical protein